MGEMRVCRACSNVLPDEQVADIQKNKLQVDISQMLQNCVPELEFKVADSCLCYKCFSLLFLFQEFKKTCIATENKIKDYLKRNPSTDYLTLLDVFAEEAVEEEKQDEEVEVVEEVIETSICVKEEDLDSNDIPDIDETEVEFSELKEEVIDLTDVENNGENKTPPNSSAYAKCGSCGHFVQLGTYLEHMGNCIKTQTDPPEAKRAKPLDTGLSYTLVSTSGPAKRLFCCKQCNFRCYSPGGLLWHVNYKHRRNYKCNKCNFSTSSAVEFNKHGYKKSCGTQQKNT